MRQFKLWNRIFGWLAFAIAAFTYLGTMEPTASFWDCPEFISTAYKFDVGHPPGAPFFMLMGHFFTLFASDVEHVALMVNAMSALASAFTILFLFWTITLLAKKVITPDAEGNYSLGKLVAIMGAGMVGALAYTWSDTFWFSAVEGEVYASSSLFTAVVFWAILKWEEVADEPYANRWLILIAYLMGLSIGVHLLNLLAIPAIALVYYFKKFKPTVKGTIAALLVSFAVLGVMMYGIIPGIVMVGSWFELFFVNSLGLSFNTGFAFFLVLLFLVLGLGIYTTYTGKHDKLARVLFVLGVSLMGMPFIAGSILLGVIIIIALTVMVFAMSKRFKMSLMNTILVAATVIAVGYSSFAVIVIRSAANPPMDQNSPDNVFSLKSYLNREQYGDRPLFYGPYYNAEIKWIPAGDNSIRPSIQEGDNVWSQKEKVDADEKDQYIITDKQRKYEYVKQFCTLFPRMYSSQGSHVSAYKSWSGDDMKSFEYENAGRSFQGSAPTFGSNLKFFFDYQIMYMYMRYFMWNFSGRQNDIQGYGEIDKGMFLTGIPFIDSIWEGDYDKLPTQMKENKGRNVYYMLPLLLGIIGLVWQLRNGKKGKESFLLTFILFFMTGLAIVLYLNQTPYQPRERDYAYAGSFYAFAIWIGFGMLGIMSLISKLVKKPEVSACVASVACLLVPVQMASQNWDDHDRSNRYTCRDFGYNYLISCAPNAIIFTNGDNDTFPLWYLQEVEGVRTDVRVCNLSYLQTDWYIDQMRRQAYDSEPLPISWKRYQYVQGSRDLLYCKNLIDEPMELKYLIDEYVLNDSLLTDGIAYCPAQAAYIPVDKSKYMAQNPWVKDSSKILDRLDVKLPERLYKHEEMIYEMLARNNWERPIYFAVTVGDSYYLGLQNNFQLEGLAYRIIPMNADTVSKGVNTDIMYDNMMNKFRWGGIENPDVYLDENNLRMCRTFRLMFNRLVEALINEGKKDKALKALDYCMKVIPATTVPHDYVSIYLADQYYQLGQTAKGDAIMAAVADSEVENITWFNSLRNSSMKKSVRDDLGHSLAVLGSVLSFSQQHGRDNILEKYGPVYQKNVY